MCMKLPYVTEEASEEALIIIIMVMKLPCVAEEASSSASFCIIIIIIIIMELSPGWLQKRHDDHQHHDARVQFLPTGT